MNANTGRNRRTKIKNNPYMTIGEKKMVENSLSLTHLDNKNSGYTPSRARTPEPCTETLVRGLLQPLQISIHNS
jgi:hypothetical protein